MPPLPIISGREALTAFQKAGWIFVRQKGSHMLLTKRGSFATLSVPDHRTLDRGTLRGLIKQSGMTVDDFIKYAK